MLYNDENCLSAHCSEVIGIIHINWPPTWTMPAKQQAPEPSLTSVLELLPGCHSTAEFKDRILPVICEVFDATSAVMHYYAGDVDYGRYYDPIYVNIDPHYLDKFRSRFSDLDPFPPAALRQSLEGQGQAFSSEQLVDMDEFGESEFYLDFLRPQGIYHMLVIVIARGDSPFAFFGMHRDRGSDPFTPDQIELANQLSSYLSATADRIHMADELSLFQRVVDTLSYGLMNKGVLILDQSLTMIYANDYACRALEHRSDFDVQVRSYPERIAEACQELLDEGDQLTAMSNANFTLASEKPQINGYIRANQSADRPLLFLAFFNSGEFGVLNPRVCEEFGLTDREIDVVRCVTEGKTNSEIAEELFISVRTVQNHLRSIFSKCGVHNRTSLSNRVLSLT